jgi:exopolysaccharide biosynthesis polyprenyl glycosylphosphotransferase
MDWIVRRVRLARGHPMRAIVIGTRADAARAMANAALSDPAEFQMVGYVDIASTAGSDAIGCCGEIVDIIAKWKVDTMVLAGGFDERLWNHLAHVADAAGCSVLTLPGTLMLEGFQPQLVWRRGVPIVQITRPGLRGHQLLMKRGLDLALSLAALLALAPVLAAIAAAVKLTSRGPVLFRQTRVGRGGGTFRICKFRSMVVDAEARLAKLQRDSVYDDARLFKMERDPRITRVGAFLRRTSLDELPQLWNVLVGDMSLVGPRPPIPSEVALYDDHHYARFDVKPGITGPWQVSGRNKIRDFEEVMRLETAYIRHWRLGKDIGILLRTVPAVLKMDGAY